LRTNFCSFSAQDFENVLDQWMEEFHFFLPCDNPALAKEDQTRRVWWMLWR
jgi:hypothetical protein